MTTQIPRMIDTMKIKIPRSEFLIQKESFFRDEDHRMLKTDNQMRTRITNWEFYMKNKNAGLYKPKFALTSSSSTIDSEFLVLEFSVPKLLFGTSLHSVGKSHYEFLIDKIHEFLQEIHISISREAIENATVVAIAYCKNVRMDNICTAYQAIGLFDKLNYIPRTDIRRITYENQSGYGVKFFNTALSFAMYDKIAEIVNNARTKEEADIAKQFKKQGFVTLKNQNPIREVLRFEVTLQNKRAVDQAMKPFIGKKESYTLKDVYSQRISESLLHDAVEKLSNHPARDLILLPNLEHPMLTAAIHKYTKTRMQRSEIIRLIQDIRNIGIQECRRLFITEMTPRTWRKRLSILHKISQELDWEELPIVTEREVLQHIMQQFNVETKHLKPKQLQLL